MRSTDRDFYMSTISVLQSQRRMIQSIADDMCMRLDELEGQIAMQYDQSEDWETEELLDSAWQSGYDYNKLQEEAAMLDYEEDAIVYDTLRNKMKLCMCDECWDVCNCEERAANRAQDYRMD
jgi:hypothetical protein